MKKVILMVVMLLLSVEAICQNTNHKDGDKKVILNLYQSTIRIKYYTVLDTQTHIIRAYVTDTIHATRTGTTVFTYSKKMKAWYTAIENAMRGNWLNDDIRYYMNRKEVFPLEVVTMPYALNGWSFVKEVK